MSNRAADAPVPAGLPSPAAALVAPPAARAAAPSLPAVPIVGIGASAGGLDPICELLASVQPGSGAAYVVIQHLDPLHKGMLPELLQRVTAMRVIEIVDRTEVAADSVYVIPPNTDLGFADGLLVLQVPQQERGHRLPIDTFFQALARERGELAAGVVLSGMGGDGTLGLQAIKQHGGLTLAQLPSSAKFDPMPRSAIAAGAADLVALPVDMPAHILAYRRPLKLPLPLLAQRRDSLHELFQLLLAQTGANFADYKLNTVLRRIERRIKLQQLRTLEQYVDHLHQNPAEVELLFKELLIGVTQFFRDQKIWEHMASTALPQLLTAHPQGLALKAWIPACSTGEEAYSLAIVFQEVIERLAPKARYTLQIFATDLDPDAIARARTGVFAATIEADVSTERLQRYFLPTEKGYRIRKDLRNSIIFAQQNVISDPPFTKLDILCCRNLLIYFNPTLQEQLIPLFHYALKDRGLLMLGSADTPGRFNDLFSPLSGNGRIYRRLDASVQRVAHYFPTRDASVVLPPPSETRSVAMTGNLQSQLEQLLLKKHTPACVVLNTLGDILYIHGRTGAFLEPAAGKANWNIHAMARDGLRYELADLIKRAGEADGLIAKRGLIVSDDAGQTQALDLTAEAIGVTDALAGMIVITFAAVALPPAKRRSRATNPLLIELEQQLAQARLEIQAVRDEMQASREELKSANEELQSTNEELQSTNEELTTSKEEMQSLNEELYTVNAELQSKVDDLSLVNGDMKNLLNSTDIATIFLDNNLRTRRFTNQATQIYKLIPSDLNRPLSDIATELQYPELARDAQGVLRTLLFSERQTATGDGRMIVSDISDRDLREDGRRRAYAVLDNIDEAVMVTDAANRIVAVNPAFSRITGFLAEETLGRDPSFLGRGINPPKLHAAAWRALLGQGRWHGEVVNARKDGTTFVAGMSLTAMRADDGAIGNFVAVFSDISARKQSETALQELTRELDARVLARTAELTDANRKLMLEVAERIRAEAALRRSREQMRQLAEHLATVKENERRRIAREIHDELGQNLLALRIDISMLRARTESTHPRLHKRVNAVLQNVDTTIRSVRGIMNELRPPVLDLGLQAAIEWQVGEFRKRSGLVCQLVMPDGAVFAAIPAEVEIVLFRSLQESLTNVQRHSSATQVEVRLALSEGRLALSVSDNGLGIAPEQRAKNGSFGLIGIGERVGALGGRFDIGAYAAGSGCTLTMSFALPGQALAL
ncbi:chemotaxis protein CheB [Rugamonas sp.]|uniref:chemotaxis protein CheB n=1 Tax=Rugamonas sp. TaxID=1926287 RepID=UPI0025FD6CFA|nr:chemotaxis protein CheB [Rugamonas sp.]